MTLETWLQSALADADRRQLPQLKPLLEGLALSLTTLRRADFCTDAAPRRGAAAHPVATSGLFPTHGTPSSHAQTPTPASQADGSAPATRGQRIPRPPLTSLTAFADQLRARHTSSQATTDACLRAIADRDPELNAFILVMADQARAQARQADAELAAGLDRGPLHGVPISLKDLVDVRGIATTAASRLRASDVASVDASVVVRLRHAGAVLIGKTNLHEFAFGTTTEDSGFGAARHPLDPSRSPGGSSGGSAISVVTGMALGSIGTDTGGSIRIPSAACGLVGLKPTMGEVATDGVVPLSATLDHVGPLAQTVSDAWHIHQALLGHPQSRPLSAAPLAGLRVGVPRRYFCDVLEPGIRAAFDSAVTTLESAGARVAQVDVAHADQIAAIYLQIVLAEAAAYHAATLESAPDAYSLPVRLRLEMGRYVLAEDYLRALTGREQLRREVDSALSWHDVLLLPTLPIVAPPLGAPTVTIDGTPHQVRNLMLRLTQLFNITGHPAVSLPCGAGAEGLPAALQIVGRRHETDVLMHVALGIERALEAG
ncbi:MAG: amidase [Vicinamibacterales bacterium]